MGIMTTTEERSISLLGNGHAEQHAPAPTSWPQIASMPTRTFRLAAPDFVPSPPYVLYATKDNTYDDRAISLTYLAEGAANSVHSIRPWTSETPSDQQKFIFLDKSRSRALCRDHFVGKLIRISKGNAKTVSGLKIKKSYERDIRPMFEGGFEEFLMDMETVVVSDDLLAGSGQEGKEKEKVGAKGKTASPHVGLLMEDMSSCANKCITIEIKPKWLVQSPNAPKGSKRCRTCAIQAQRVAMGEKKMAGYLCPLQLSHGNVEMVKPYLQKKVLREVERFGADAPFVPDDYVAQVLTEYLAEGEGNRLLRHLSRLQAGLDRSGILEVSWPETELSKSTPSSSNSVASALDTTDPPPEPHDSINENTETDDDEPTPPQHSHHAEMTLLHALLGTTMSPPTSPIRVSHLFPNIISNLTPDPAPDPNPKAILTNLRLAMTLRDCSMLIRLTYSPDGMDRNTPVRIEAKLADLDFKSADKFEDWAEKERGLVDGGWYLGSGDGGEEEEEGCWIARKTEGGGKEGGNVEMGGM